MYDILTLILASLALGLFILKLSNEYSYHAMYIKIISGKGKGQVRRIDKGIISHPWSEVPDSTSEYVIN